MRAVPLLVGLSLLASPFVSRPAAAQTLPSFDARTWRPSTDPSAGMVLEPTTTPGPWSWNVGAWLSYAHHPVTLRDPSTGEVALRPAESLLGLDLVAGLGLGARASIGLSVPMAIYQSGTRPLPRAVATSGELPSSAIGDLGVHGKVSLVDASGGGFGLAALATVTMPTGDRSSFLGEGAVTAGARLLAEYTLLVASVQASVGYTLRTEPRTWPDASAGGIQLGDVMPWTIGASIKPEVFKIDPGHRQRWDLAFHGWIPATPVGPFGAGDPGSARQTPVLASLSDRIELGHYRDSYVLAGVEVGLNDAIGVPALRGVLAIGWAPRGHDMDNDGVPDDVDQCPELAEDRDGFEDSDGCPELDNDDDGLLDKEDACPNVAGVPSPDPRKNGCPQPDRDGDGVADDQDACPDKKGIEGDDPRTNGCPVAGDRDHDGVPDDVDRCPDQPEDKDGFQDDDGCPDPDDDGDGISDAQDACPREAGQPSSDAARNGCPNADRDGDTYDNAVDRCPDEPETFNGVQDDDGCPDTGGAPLVVVQTPETKPRFKIGLTATNANLRAVVLEANRHPDWTLLVAAQPEKVDAGLTRANVIAGELDRLAHRDLAEPVAWGAVAKEPATMRDVKIVIVVGGRREATPAPLPPVPKP